MVEREGLKSRPRYLLTPEQWIALQMEEHLLLSSRRSAVVQREQQRVLNRVVTKPLEQWYFTTLLNTELLSKRLYYLIQSHLR